MSMKVHLNKKNVNILDGFMTISMKKKINSFVNPKTHSGFHSKLMQSEMTKETNGADLNILSMSAEFIH